MTNENVELDYVYWSKWDKWSFKQAALLLHSLDPTKYSEVPFNLKAPPKAKELYEPYKVYLLLNKCDDFKYSNGGHPFDIFRFAEKKEFPIPDELKSEILKRLEKEMQPKKSQFAYNPGAIPDKELETRERNALYKGVALMAYMLAARSERYRVASHPNSHQIAQDILGTAEAMGVDTTGLKSFNRKIKEALRFLEQEQDKEPES